MISVTTLKGLLNFKDEDIKKLKTDQLRLLLGVLRFSTRAVQREINERDPIVVSENK